MKRLVTVGAVGSHHVLATTLFGGRAGLAVEAVLVPQPGTAHAERNLRADLALGLGAHAAPHVALAPFATLAVWGFEHETMFIPMGGSNALGALGYVDAAHELAAQVRRGELPRPDLVVVTVGSGGTAAGLAAGFAKAELDVPILGVAVATPVFAVRLIVHRLVSKVAVEIGADPRHARGLLSIASEYLGGGYGVPTPAGEAAMRAARDDAGMCLDPTYTAKTFAAALDVAATGRYSNVLYWHTLSSAPLEPLLVSAPLASEVPAHLRSLLR
ncbi:MAG: pyridoxal-phosphate dependent enzyme [Polyangiaceae bacterium]